jgi:hypothetical protein
MPRPLPSARLTRLGPSLLTLFLLGCGGVATLEAPISLFPQPPVVRRAVHPPRPATPAPKRLVAL